MERKKYAVGREEKQAIQCLIRGYGLLDDKESSEKVLNLVEEGLKTDYLNDSAKRELLQYQASALEKKKRKRRQQTYMQRYWRMRRNRVREKSCIKRWYSCMKLQEEGIWQAIHAFRG